MGNRAVITFDAKPTKNSVGVYLHWNGGPESVYTFLDALEHYGVRDGTDGTYQLARFVQIVSNFMGGTLSVGCGLLRDLDTDGDNGVYAVTRLPDGKGKTVMTVRRSTDNMKTWWSPAKVAKERRLAKKHAYNAGADNMLKVVIERNDEAFHRDLREAQEAPVRWWRDKDEVLHISASGFYETFEKDENLEAEVQLCTKMIVQGQRKVRALQRFLNSAAIEDSEAVQGAQSFRKLDAAEKLIRS